MAKACKWLLGAPLSPVHWPATGRTQEEEPPTVRWPPSPARAPRERRGGGATRHATADTAPQSHVYHERLSDAGRLGKRGTHAPMRGTRLHDDSLDGQLDLPRGGQLRRGRPTPDAARPKAESRQAAVSAATAATAAAAAGDGELSSLSHRRCSRRTGASAPRRRSRRAQSPPLCRWTFCPRTARR